MEAIRVRRLNHANLHVECDFGQAAEIKEFFSFFVPGYQWMPAFKRRIWDGKIRLFSPATGQIYVGLLSYIKNYCNNLFLSNEFVPATSEQKLSKGSGLAQRRIIQVILNSFLKLKTPRSEDRGASSKPKTIVYGVYSSPRRPRTITRPYMSGRTIFLA